MDYTLNDALQIAENLISAIKGCKDEEMTLKLEATLMCFQFHIKTLTNGVLQ
jgi:hypothetical protein